MDGLSLYKEILETREERTEKNMVITQNQMAINQLRMIDKKEEIRKQQWAEEPEKNTNSQMHVQKRKNSN